MPIIKRYPNRKLYDTAAKQYVSLDGIAAMIRRGDEVQVVDHATGEDLTTLTLTQIIVEQEKAAERIRAESGPHESDPFRRQYAGKSAAQPFSASRSVSPGG